MFSISSITPIQQVITIYLGSKLTLANTNLVILVSAPIKSNTPSSYLIVPWLSWHYAITRPQSHCNCPDYILPLLPLWLPQSVGSLYRHLFDWEQLLLQAFVIHHLTIIIFCPSASLPFNYPECYLSHSNM